MKNLGLLLIVVGIIMMAITGFNYVTREKVVDVGPVQISADKKHHVQWTPILGAVILVSGIALVVVNKNKN